MVVFGCDVKKHNILQICNEIDEHYGISNLNVEPGNPSNHRPQFQAEFDVPEENPEAHG